MIKVSELIGKPLICLGTAEVLGTVGNIVFDSKMRTAKYLKVYCDDDTEPEFQYVALRRLRRLDSDACVMSDRCGVMYDWNTEKSGVSGPVNSECFNQDGKSLGRVRDILLDGFNIKTILADKAELDPGQILSYSDRLLIFNDTGKPLKFVRRKPSVPKTNPEIIASIHRSEAETAEAELPPEKAAAAFNPLSRAIRLPARVPPEATLVSRTPQKEPGADGGVYAFLLGKKISRDIHDDGGGVLIKMNSFITEDTIRVARQAGKLVQLALYAD